MIKPIAILIQYTSETMPLICQQDSTSKSHTTVVMVSMKPEASTIFEWGNRKRRSFEEITCDAMSHPVFP